MNTRTPKKSTVAMRKVPKSSVDLINYANKCDNPDQVMLGMLMAMEYMKGAVNEFSGVRVPIQPVDW